MPNFNYIMKIRPNLLSQCKAVDGKIYSLPDYAETLHVQYGNKMFCNKALLEELGKEIPTTIDEMYEAMVAFKAAHPEGVAYAACTVENSAPWGFLTNAWTYSTFNTGDAGELGLRDHNGTVESILDDEEYRAALRFLNKLYTEELLYEGSFTMDGNQMKALLASETPVLFWSGMHNVNFVDGAATPELYANQKPVAPLRGPDGAQYVTFFPSVPTAGFAISKTCENVELAIKLADIHYSQIGFWTVNEGREGIEWVWAEEGQVGVSGAPAIANRTGAYISGLQNVKWEPNALRAQIDEICTSWFDEANYDETDPADGMFFRPKMTAELYVPYYQDKYQTIPDPKFNSEEEEELSMISVSLENYVAESRVDRKSVV